MATPNVTRMHCVPSQKNPNLVTGKRTRKKEEFPPRAEKNESRFFAEQQIQEPIFILPLKTAIAVRKERIIDAYKKYCDQEKDGVSFGMWSKERHKNPQDNNKAFADICYFLAIAGDPCFDQKLLTYYSRPDTDVHNHSFSMYLLRALFAPHILMPDSLAKEQELLTKILLHIISKNRNVAWPTGWLPVVCCTPDILKSEQARFLPLLLSKCTPDIIFKVSASHKKPLSTRLLKNMLNYIIPHQLKLPGMGKPLSHYIKQEGEKKCSIALELAEPNFGAVDIGIIAHLPIKYLALHHRKEIEGATQSTAHVFEEPLIPFHCIAPQKSTLSKHLASLDMRGYPKKLISQINWSALKRGSQDNAAHCPKLEKIYVSLHSVPTKNVSGILFIAESDAATFPEISSLRFES